MSPQQLHTATEIIRRERVIIGDEPGTRKTAPAGLAKYGLERKLGKKVKTLVLCPGYLINNWITKLDEYLVDEPTYCVITPEDREEDLRRAARSDVDFVFVSYDLLYKELEKENGEEVGEDEQILMRTDELVERYKGDKIGAVNYLTNTRKRHSNDGDPLIIHKLTEKSGLDEICLAAAFEEAEIEDREKRYVFSELVSVLTHNHPDDTSRHDFYLIADEFHNVRDHTLKKKTNAFYELAKRARFATFLSGTKTPNDIRDIAVVASVLDPERFATPQDFVSAVGNNPGAVRRFYAQWQKEPKLTAEEVSGVEIPDAMEIGFELSDTEKEIFLQIVNSKTLSETDKLLLTRYATIDMQLLHSDRYEGSKSMVRKIKEVFIDGEVELIESNKGVVSSRYKALEEALSVIPEDEKAIIFCKHTMGVTVPITKYLIQGGRNVVRVDQTVSSQNRKIRLNRGEVVQLKKQGLYVDQKYRVDLKRSERELLGLNGQRTMHYSERDKVVLEFQTNPDVDTIVATYGTLREGRDLHAGNHVVQFERDWEPGIERQALGRALGRSGQEREGHLYELICKGTIDIGIRDHVRRKASIIDIAERCSDAISIEDARSLTGRVKPQGEREIIPWLYSSPQFVRMILGRLSGGGVAAMDELIRNGLAQAFVDHFNHRWEASGSSNRGRLIEMAMHHLGIKGKEIVELGSGPAQLARILRRPTVCVDYLKGMLEYGKKAANDLGFEIETYQGSIHHMPFLGDERFDFSVAANVLNLLSQEQRVEAIRENRRILRDESYGIWLLPPSAFADETGEILRKLKMDFILAGFELDEGITGRYKVIEAIDFRTLRPKPEGQLVHLLLAGKKVSEGKIENKMFELMVDYSFSKPKKEPKGTEKNGGKDKEENLGELSIGFKNLDTGLELRRVSLDIIRERIKEFVEGGGDQGAVIAALTKIARGEEL